MIAIYSFPDCHGISTHQSSDLCDFLSDIGFIVCMYICCPQDSVMLQEMEEGREGSCIMIEIRDLVRVGPIMHLPFLPAPTHIHDPIRMYSDRELTALRIHDLGIDDSCMIRTRKFQGIDA